MENAVNNINGDLSAVQFAKLTHCQLQFCASSIFSEIIKGEERALRVRKSFIYGGKLTGIGNHGVVGSGNVTAFKNMFDQRNKRLSAVLIFCGKKNRF